MPSNRINYDVLNDDVRWADPYECSDLLFAGIWFLYETLRDRHATCSLIDRIRSHGVDFKSRYQKVEGDVTKVTNAEMAARP